VDKSEECSFCGSNVDKVGKLFKSSLKSGACICDGCLDTIVEIQSKNRIQTIDKNILIPVTLKSILDQYVVGQEDAKRTLSVAIYNHILRTTDISDESIEKSNVLLLGPSGCGKTYLVHTLAKYLDIPCTIADATVLTESGYVGEDVETILQPLLTMCDGNIQKAETGIIIIDEIDKKSRKSANPSLTRDVSGEGVQNGLLKLIEGTVANVHAPGTRKHPHSQFTKVNTKDILFIFLGAFVGLTDVVSERLGKNTVGFNSEKGKIQKSDRDHNLLSCLEPDDLVKYGLIPELVGRIPIVTYVDELSENDLYNILTKTKNNVISQYKSLLKKDNIVLDFEDQALRLISRVSSKKGTGARSLRGIIERVVCDLIFSIDRTNNLNIVVTEKLVKDKLHI